MLKLKMTRRLALAAAAAVAFTGPALAGGHQILDSVHFLIPGGAGGGWDGTARGTGEALTESGIVGTASYENMSGGGGGKAIGYLIENAESNYDTLMVNSTPIIIRSLTGVFPQNFRDLTLVAGTIGDYAALVVKADSEIDDMAGLLAKFDADPNGTVESQNTNHMVSHELFSFRKEAFSLALGSIAHFQWASLVQNTAFLNAGS